LADAGRPDHQDVLRHHLFAHLAVELLAAPAVAQGDGHGALGVLLADDVAVELGNDLAGGKSGHGMLCTRSWKGIVEADVGRAAPAIKRRAAAGQASGASMAIISAGPNNVVRRS